MSTKPGIASEYNWVYPNPISTQTTLKVVTNNLEVQWWSWNGHPVRGTDQNPCNSCRPSSNFGTLLQSIREHKRAKTGREGGSKDVKRTIFMSFLLSLGEKESSNRLIGDSVGPSEQIPLAHFCSNKCVYVETFSNQGRWERQVTQNYLLTVLDTVAILLQE